jgi:hypothetical protein
MNEFSSGTEKNDDVIEEGEGNHYNDESVATNYESAFFYDNLEYRDWYVL